MRLMGLLKRWRLFQILSRVFGLEDVVACGEYEQKAYNAVFSRGLPV